MRVPKNILLLCVLLVVCFAAVAMAGKPANEKGLLAMLEAGFDDDEIIAKLKKDGVEFEVTDEVLERLKEAGLSDEVLAAVEKAGKKSPRDGGQLITYESVLKLLQAGVDPETIIEKLKKSPTVFTLDAEQEAELREADATDELIAYMKSPKEGAESKEPISDLAIVLDCSKSMLETTSDGETKMNVAKEVVSDLVDKLPDGLHVAFVIYGHKPGCNDNAVKVVRPVESLDADGKGDLIALVRDLRPVGNTPIALALETTGRLFTPKVYSGVVLITDGRESCNGKPDEEAARLAENEYLAFGVNVVGFGLKEDEREDTTAIAAAGRGKYYDAQNREELIAAIEDVTERIEPVEPPRSDRSPGRREVVFAKPKFKFPETAAILVHKAGTRFGLGSVRQPDVKIKEFGKKTRLLKSPEGYDFYWQGDAGLVVEIATGVKVADDELVELRLEDYLGLIRINGEGLPKPSLIRVTRPGLGSIITFQEASEFGVDLVVQAGKYNVWMFDENDEKTVLEEDLEIEAGKVTEI